jgi:hypothetical protein
MIYACAAGAPRLEALPPKWIPKTGREIVCTPSTAISHRDPRARTLVSQDMSLSVLTGSPLPRQRDFILPAF